MTGREPGRAQAFVEDWLSERIAETRADGAEAVQAEALVQECRAAADAEGVSRTEIGTAFGDLAGYFEIRIRDASAAASRLSGRDVA